MISFDLEHRKTAREWLLRLFEDKKCHPSAIYKSGKVMEDAIIKYPEDSFAFSTLDEEQFDAVFSKFEDDSILVVSNFQYLLQPENFVDGTTKDSFTNVLGTYTFVINNALFNYKTYLGINEQFSWIAYIDQKSGRTLLALPELNFLIYP